MLMLGRDLDVQKKMEKLVWRSLKIDLPRDLLFENFDTCKFELEVCSVRTLNSL